MSLTKKDLRQQFKQIRDQFVRTHDVQVLSQQLLTIFLEAQLISQQKGPVAGYWPVGSEIDCRPILTHYWSKGTRCALPVIQENEWLLDFREWTPNTPLSEGKFNISHPPSTQSSIAPGILLVPLLAFDCQGNRLGMGGGYYDTTIAHYRALTSLKVIGLAFDCQETDFIPTQKEDQCLDYIVTPTRVIFRDPFKL